MNENFKFQSLLHSAITELIKNNIPLNIVKEIARHKAIATTMIYSHVKRNDLREAVNFIKLLRRESVLEHLYVRNQMI